MLSFHAFITEEPAKALVTKALRGGFFVLAGSSGVGAEPDDYDWHVERLPIRKVVTRERKPSTDALVSQYERDDDRIPPIVVQQRSDGKYLVVDGHHRLRSAKDAGMTDIWAIVVGAKHGRGSDTLCTCGHERRYHNGSWLFDGWGDCTQCACKQFKPR